MAANPALVRLYTNELVPAPFPGEYIALRRPGVTLDLDNLNVPGGRWSSRPGSTFLTNFRMVFISDVPDPSGLVAFDIPLVYVTADSLNQPIFGANNLSGKVWPVHPYQGRDESRPPHSFRLYFKNGGMGTFYPLYFMLKERARALHHGPSAVTPSAPPPPTNQPVENLVSRAYVDPSDPSTLYLVQPVDESQRLREQPRYAANYGQDEKYEDMGLRP